MKDKRIDSSSMSSDYDRDLNMRDPDESFFHKDVKAPGIQNRQPVT